MNQSPPDKTILTTAAHAALEKYLAQERQHIIAEARSLSSHASLQASDIINAFEALQARSKANSRANYLPDAKKSFWQRYYELLRRAYLPLMFTMITLGIASIFVGFANPDLLAPTDGSSGQIALLTIGTTYVSLGTVGLIYRKRLHSFPYLVSSKSTSEVRVHDSDSLRSSRSISYRDPRYENFSLIGDFMQRWFTVEDRIKRVANESPRTHGKNFERYPLGGILLLLHETGIIDDSLSEDISVLLKIRNGIVHGEGYTNSELKLAIEKINAISFEIIELLAE